jgi:hypothetical protein
LESGVLIVDMCENNLKDTNGFIDRSTIRDKIFRDHECKKNYDKEVWGTERGCT